MGSIIWQIPNYVDKVPICTLQVHYLDNQWDEKRGRIQIT